MLLPSERVPHCENARFFRHPYRYNLTEAHVSERLLPLNASVAFIPITIAELSDLYNNASSIDSAAFVLTTTYHGSCTAQMYKAAIIATQSSWPAGPGGAPSSRACAVVRGLHAQTDPSVRSLFDLVGRNRAIYTTVTRNTGFPARNPTLSRPNANHGCLAIWPRMHTSLIAGDVYD